ncbi:MAG: hypothetical protein AD742_11090 [Methylibium sp. NZG]|nr:MAG: hypothetical protein AD742_11090 [Methylibium sp. NZG]
MDPTDDELALLLRRSLQALPDVPPWATERALAVWRTPASAAPAPGLLQRLTATLGFDSWQPQPGLALRGRSQGPRQLLFSVGGHDIDLRVLSLQGPEPRHAISGQVLGPATEGGVTWLPLAPGAGAETVETADATGSQEVALDDLGEFVISGLTSARGVVRLRLAGHVVYLSPIDLSATGPEG